MPTSTPTKPRSGAQKAHEIDTRQFPWVLGTVKLKQCIVAEYQRPLTDFADEIESEFDPALVGTLCVSRRSANKFALIDGQTRHAAMTRLGIDEWSAVIYEDLKPSQEAALFYKFQTKRRNMLSQNVFKAKVFAEEPQAVAINKVVEDCGFFVGNPANGNGSIPATGSLTFVYQGTVSGKRGAKTADPDLLRDTLTVIRNAWPSLPLTAKSASMIKGLGWFLARNPDGSTPRDAEVDLDRLEQRLSKTTPSDLARKADMMREAKGMSGNAPAYMAEAIDAQYRKRG
jgi:hypothetical protein